MRAEAFTGRGADEAVSGNSSEFPGIQTGLMGQHLGDVGTLNSALKCAI